MNVKQVGQRNACLCILEASVCGKHEEGMNCDRGFILESVLPVAHCANLLQSINWREFFLSTLPIRP